MVEILFDSFATRSGLFSLFPWKKRRRNGVFIAMGYCGPQDLKTLKSRSLLLIGVKCKGTPTNKNQTPLPALVFYDLFL